MRNTSLFWVSLLAFIVIASVAPVVHADFGPPRIATLPASGDPADGSSHRCALSADGRYLVFESLAGNFTAAATNGKQQVYLLDRASRSFELISAVTGGNDKAGDGSSTRASISADGRLVAFESAAYNLVSNDSAGQSDIFYRDRSAQATVLVSVPYDEHPASYASTYPAISSDGSYFTFRSAALNIVSSPVDTNYFTDVILSARDRLNTVFASTALGNSSALGNNHSDGGWPALSVDGSLVVYGSRATNLVASDTNVVSDVFAFQRNLGTNERISLTPEGGEFEFAARALGPGSVDATGALVLFVVDGAPAQLYLRDRTAGTTTLISQNPQSGQPGNGPTLGGVLSADGRYVAFASRASNLVGGARRGGVFLLDRASNSLELIDEEGTQPCISADAQVIGYDRFDAANSVAHIYVRRTDLCPNSADKEEPGLCGCSLIETDLNRSGMVDCLEGWYKPKAPRVKKTKGGYLVSFLKFKGAQYQLYIKKGKKLPKPKLSKKSSYLIKKIKRGKYVLSYRMSVPAGESARALGLESSGKVLKVR